MPLEKALARVHDGVKRMEKAGGGCTPKTNHVAAGAALQQADLQGTATASNHAAVGKHLPSSESTKAQHSHKHEMTMHPMHMPDPCRHASHGTSHPRQTCTDQAPACAARADAPHTKHLACCSHAWAAKKPQADTHACPNSKCRQHEKRSGR